MDIRKLEKRILIWVIGQVPDLPVVVIVVLVCFTASSFSCFAGRRDTNGAVAVRIMRQVSRDAHSEYHYPYPYPFLFV